MPGHGRGSIKTGWGPWPDGSDSDRCRRKLQPVGGAQGYGVLAFVVAEPGAGGGPIQSWRIRRRVGLAAQRAIGVVQTWRIRIGMTRGRGLMGRRPKAGEAAKQQG